jgi:hypothetical protein
LKPDNRRGFEGLGFKIGCQVPLRFFPKKKNYYYYLLPLLLFFKKKKEKIIKNQKTNKPDVTKARLVVVCAVLWSLDGWFWT